MRSPTTQEIEEIYINLNLDEGTIESAAEQAGIDISDISEEEIARCIYEDFNMFRCSNCGVWIEGRCDMCGSDPIKEDLEWDIDLDGCGF